MPPERSSRKTDSHDTEDLFTPSSPPTIDPYATLSLSSSATASEVKSAYRRAALLHHPDKAAPEDKATAHTKFQEVAFAYAILSDERRRKRYDSTGSTEEILEGEGEDGEFNWTDFFREQYAAVVTSETIDAFAQEYKGGEEERRDVLEAYGKVRGDMEKLYQYVMLSEADEDEERFRGIIEEAIEKGEVEGFEKFTGESESRVQKRMERSRKRREREGKEAEKVGREMEEDLERTSRRKGTGKKGGMEDLAALIQGRQAGREGRKESFLQGLEEKYGAKGKSGKKRAEPVDEPPEEAFAKNRAKKSKR
ncbi:uncharacterized protein LTR77_001284 [Saxophila tyrrhenica]|uniref:J domain-containing protein n=1 Tax=Saxophila tyrrhenica TaxID=1690608 RepID=A0AAV9PNA4_9PEZI|nr:hypothetical protein LTR77_001284 [Saxophila tyrrhenica]